MSFVNTTTENGPNTPFQLEDIDFSAPGEIYTGGGFTFTASAFDDFIETTNFKAFTATGTITGNGFDATSGSFALSTQETDPSDVRVSFSSTLESDQVAPIPVPAAGLLLLGGLGGLAAMRRRK